MFRDRIQFREKHHRRYGVPLVRLLREPPPTPFRAPTAFSYQVMGRTRQNRPVFLDGDITELKGKLVKTKITECRPWSLTGVAQGEPY